MKELTNPTAYGLGTVERPGATPAQLVADPERRTGRIRWAGNPGQFTDGTNPRKFDAVGSWLVVTRIVGPGLIYVQLNEGSSWQPVREGELLRRRFNQVRFMASNPLADLMGGVSLVVAKVIVEAYFGDGEAPEVRPPSYGIRAPFVVQVGTATVAGVKLAPPTNSANVSPNFGRDGGTLLLRNDDNSNDLLVGYGSATVAPDPANCWRIPAGQRETFTFDREMSRRPAGDAGLALWVLTTLGVTNFRALYSAHVVDLADPDQAVTFAGPSLTGN